MTGLLIFHQCVHMTIVWMFTVTQFNFAVFVRGYWEENPIFYVNCTVINREVLVSLLEISKKNNVFVVTSDLA